MTTSNTDCGFSWIFVFLIIVIQSLTVQRLRVGQVLLKLLVQVFADADVLEHPLQFGRVLETTGLLQKHNRRCQRRKPTKSKSSINY